MEMVSLKLDENMLKTMDKSLRKHNFSTRTEFIRDAIREKLEESMYANNETPLGNQALARQRALGNAAVWNNWFYGCPQVQTKLDEGLILFDDRVVDVNNLKSHPLYNPAFLRDHWTEIRSGALTMPKEYVMELLALSENHSSSVRAVKHRDLTEINQDIPTATISTNPYLKAFLGLSDAERAAYIKEHETRKGKRLGLYCSLVDAQEEAQGRLSVFNNNIILYGYNLDYDYARVLGVPASVASLSAEGAAKKDSLAAYLRKFVPEACLEDCIAGIPFQAWQRGL